MQGRSHLRSFIVFGGGGVIIKWVLQKLSVTIRAIVFWIRIGNSVGFCWRR